jgi:hypothetical protein
MTPGSLARNWRVKGILQGVLSLVPGGVDLNDRLQTGLGGLTNFASSIGAKVSDWGLMVQYLRAAGVETTEGWDTLEIGTGWYPVFPLCFALAGARSGCTVDLNRHLNERLTLEAVRALEAHLDEIASHAGKPPETVRRQWKELASAGTLSAVLSAAKIDYRAPQDAAKLHWIPDGTLHLVYSNSVFEHIPPPVIPLLFRESRRALRDDGLICHEVACNDHYANFDPGISFVNYLRYPEWQWRLWNNRIQYQNRLRASDFTRMARESGFRIVSEVRHIRPGTQEALARMRVAPQFQGYGADDLASTTMDFVGAKQKP